MTVLAEPLAVPLAHASRSARRWLALAVLALAQFLVVLDASIVNIALPELGKGLGLDPSLLSWVITRAEPDRTAADAATATVDLTSLAGWTGATSNTPNVAFDFLFVVGSNLYGVLVSGNSNTRTVQARSAQLSWDR